MKVRPNRYRALAVVASERDNWIPPYNNWNICQRQLFIAGPQLDKFILTFYWFILLQPINSAEAHHEALLQDPLQGHRRSMEDAALAIHLQPGGPGWCRPEGQASDLVVVWKFVVECVCARVYVFCMNVFEE